MADATTALLPRARRLLLPALLGSLLASGCGLTGDPEPAGPEEAGEQVAAALGERTLTGVDLVDPAAGPALAALVEPLADLPVSVDLIDVEETSSDEGEDADSARLGLAWQWDVGGDFWDYESSATLVRDTDDPDRWLLEWTPSLLHPELVEGDTLGFSQPVPPRGRVLGAGGAPIVVDRPVKRYGVDKSKTSPRGALDGARQIADVFDLDRAAYVEKVKAYGPEAFVEAIVLRAEDALDQVPSSYGAIPGAAVVDGEVPLAPTRDFAAELLGRVGPATAEIVEESGGRVRPGDEVGISGLQARYDAELFGTRGAVVTATSAEGEQKVLHSRDPQPGADLETTLDPVLQQRAEALLEPVEGSAAALVAIRPSTGHLLAAANGPGSDLNVATFGQYAPGSTFKVVSALALLRAGRKPGDPLPCPATTVVDGRTFKNYDDYPAGGLGPITFRQAVANSCNTAMIDAREAVDEGRLAAAAASLGLGVDHDLGFPAYFGQVPEPEGETERAASMIGQGRVLASPMTMAAVAASVAAGRTVLPVLLPGQPSAGPTGDPLTAGEADQLRELMRAVVTEGSGRMLSDLPGDVGAKTGTAEFGTPGPGGELPTHAWMIAFRDDLAVAVFVERGDSGSGTAGPILEAFLRG